MGQCMCKPGFGGEGCSECDSGYYNHPNCQGIAINGLEFVINIIFSTAFQQYATGQIVISRCAQLIKTSRHSASIKSSKL